MFPRSFPEVHWPPEVSPYLWLSGPEQDSPPYRVILFRDSIVEGALHVFCLVFTWYRINIAEIPLLYRGVSHLKCACLARGRGIAPNLLKLRHLKPHGAG